MVLSKFGFLSASCLGSLYHIFHATRDCATNDLPIPVASDLGGTRHNCHLPVLGSHSALLSLPGSLSLSLAHSRCVLSRQGAGGHTRASGLRSCTIAGNLSSSPMVSFETRRVQATTAVQVDLLVWGAGAEDPRFWDSRTRSYICPVKKARTPLCLPPALRAPRYLRTRSQVSRVPLDQRWAEAVTSECATGSCPRWAKATPK